MKLAAQQNGIPVMQGIKEQASKCDSTVKSFKDTYGSPSGQVNTFSGSVDSTVLKAANRLKPTEDSVRRIMYFSSINNILLHLAVFYTIHTNTQIYWFIWSCKCFKVSTFVSIYSRMESCAFVAQYVLKCKEIL